MPDVKKQLTDKQRIEFAKQLEYFYEINHPRWRRVITFSLVKGLATGLGLVIGGTIVVALVLWILSLLGQVPFLDEITEPTKETIKQGAMQ